MAAGKPPNYVEAHPRFDLIHALGRKGRERPICRFFTERDTCRGEAFIVEALDDVVLLGYVFLGGERPGARTDPLQTVRAPNGVDNQRRYFVCPDCKKRARTLVFRTSWACQGCQGLLHRIQLIGKDVAAWEEMDEIRARLAGGRPDRRWQETHLRERLRDRARLKDLRKQGGRSRKVASQAHRYLVTPRWHSLEEVPELAHPHYIISDDRIVRKPPDDFERETEAAPEPPPSPAPIKKPGFTFGNQLLDPDEIDVDDL